MKLKKIQNKLAEKVVLKDEYGKIERVGGVDVAYLREKAICAFVVVDFASLSVVKKVVVETNVTFPYIPTFLAFREIKPIAKALRKVGRESFDILMIDGHGIAHPRRLGIASHIGVLIKKPTIGVAKKLLFGRLKGELKPNIAVEIVDNGDVLGYALKRKNYRPIYISPGNMITPKSALNIVKRMIKNKLPEPIKMAHNLANSYKRRISFG